MNKFIVSAALILGAFSLQAQSGERERPDPIDRVDWERPDHAQNAADFARDAANDFGHGNLGDAAREAGYSAGAAFEAAKEAFDDFFDSDDGDDGGQ